MLGLCTVATPSFLDSGYSVGVTPKLLQANQATPDDGGSGPVKGAIAASLAPSVTSWRGS
jgi:hypothetical protein